MQAEQRLLLQIISKKASTRHLIRFTLSRSRSFIFRPSLDKFAMKWSANRVCKSSDSQVLERACLRSTRCFCVMFLLDLIMHRVGHRSRRSELPALIVLVFLLVYVSSITYAYIGS